MPLLLLVDDEPGLLDYLSTVLRNHGYECLVASSHHEAVELLERCPPERRPSVAIVDVILGEQNGIDTAGTLVRSCPALDILLISGYANHVVSTPFANGRRAAFLTKPFSVGELLAALKTLIGD